MRFVFRLRTLMTLVAVLGVAAWLGLDVATSHRRESLRRRADSYAFGEADILEEIAEKLAAARKAEAEGPDGRARSVALRAEAEKLARVAAWHVKMERLYADAVDHPWERVPEELLPR